jgi:hypothetical protein
MTQTIGAKSMRNVVLSWSTNNYAANNDISGVANSVEVSGGDRITGEVYTSQGDTPIVLFGKLEPFDVTCRIVYSEVVTEAFTLLLARYSAGTDIKLRWIPDGGYTYTTATCQLTSFGYPGGAVEDGDPIMIEMAVRTNAITQA